MTVVCHFNRVVIIIILHCVATLGEGVQCCDTERRRAVSQHWEKTCSVAKACSVATLGEGVQCCDTGRRRAVL